MSANYSEDVEMLDAQDDEEQEEVGAELDPECEHPFRFTVNAYLNVLAEASDSEGEAGYGDEDDLPPALAKGDRNSQLTVGYKGDRSYVVRGNNIGVFNQDSDRQVKYYATISNITTPKGKGFKPKEVPYRQ